MMIKKMTKHPTQTNTQNLKDYYLFFTPEIIIKKLYSTTPYSYIRLSDRVCVCISGDNRKS